MVPHNVWPFVSGFSLSMFFEVHLCCNLCQCFLRLNNIPLCGYTTFYHSCVDGLLAIVNSTAGNIHVQVDVGVLVFSYLM